MYGIEGLDAVPPLKSHEAENSAVNERLFKKYVDRGIQECISKLKNDFEEGVGKKDELPFHNSDHTLSVINRTERILTAVQKVLPQIMTEQSIALAKLAAAFHDIEQVWSQKDGERKRFTEQNEFMSTVAAREFMRKVNIETGIELFKAVDFMVVGYALHATIPKYSTENQTVVQPGLFSDMPYEAQAVALADLASAGMDGPGLFLREGDALFREEKLDILDLLESEEDIPEEKQQEIVERIRKWSHFQVAFAEGRKAVFLKEIDGFPEQAQKEITLLFDKFDDSINAARTQAEKRDRMGYKELMKDIGYDI